MIKKRSFAKNESGSALIMAAAAFFPIMLIVMAMNDLGRSWIAIERLETAVSAAAGISATYAYRVVDGSEEAYCDPSDSSWTRIESIAQAMMDQNFPRNTLGLDVEPDVTVTCDLATGTITVKSELPMEQARGLVFGGATESLLTSSASATFQMAGEEVSGFDATAGRQDGFKMKNEKWREKRRELREKLRNKWIKYLENREGRGRHGEAPVGEEVESGSDTVKKTGKYRSYRMTER